MPASRRCILQKLVCEQRQQADSSARRCVFAHTDEELRPRPGQGDQEFSFKLRLMHGATELFSCENHGTFRSKNRCV